MFLADGAPYEPTPVRKNSFIFFPIFFFPFIPTNTMRFCIDRVKLYGFPRSPFFFFFYEFFPRARKDPQKMFSCTPIMYRSTHPSKKLMEAHVFWGTLRKKNDLFGIKQIMLSGGCYAMLYLTLLLTTLCPYLKRTYVGIANNRHMIL